MSRRYELVSSITVSASAEDLEVLAAVLEDEERRVGSRASFALVREDDRLVIEVRASDATALKTAISAISAIIRTAEKMTTIGELHGTASASARDPR